MQLKIEQEALKKETDAASKDRLKKLRAELAELQEKSDSLTARWRAEKDKIGLAQKLKEELDAARNALAQAQRKGDFAEAGQARLWDDSRAREEARRGRDAARTERWSTRR